MIAMTESSNDPARRPQTVPATLKLLSLLEREFDVLEDFHPAYDESLTIVDKATRSALTVVIVESFEHE